MRAFNALRVFARLCRNDADRRPVLADMTKFPLTGFLLAVAGA